VLLQLLALSRQYESTHAAASAETKQAPPYGRGLRAHGEQTCPTYCTLYDVRLHLRELTDPRPSVAALAVGLCVRVAVALFYGNQDKCRWRGQLAWCLFQMQQQGNPCALQRVGSNRRTRASLSVGRPSVCMGLTAVSLSLARLCVYVAPCAGLHSSSAAAAGCHGAHTRVHAADDLVASVESSPSTAAHSGYVFQAHTSHRRFC
jgi:hypothetical protein